MNRGVMQRQMFARGGAPGLSPIPQGNMGLPNLPEGVRNNMGYMAMGGSVPPMQPPVYMANGGPPMMPPEGIMSAAPPGMTPQMPPSPEMMANEGAQMMDQNALAGMLGEAEQAGFSDPEQAGSLEEMMNSVSGEQKSPEERRNDLASIVGPEDAGQTPESVLALVTPVVQIALVDQGIGPMAQEQMNTPVEGDMGGGIMSMAANGNMGVGNEPPVNFNLGGEVRRRGDEDPVPVFEQGGPVRYMERAGVVLSPNDFSALNKAGELFEADTSGVTSTPYVEKKEPVPNRLKELFEQKKGVYGDILGSSEDQKNMTQAQMLFDIANTALTFAAPMQGEKAGLSPAQRLAMAATQTKLPQTIAARSADLSAQKQKLDLAALQAAETTLTAEDKAASAKEIALAKDTSKAGSFVVATNAAGKVIGRYDQNNSSDKLAIKNLGSDITIKKIGTESAENKKNKLIAMYVNGKYTEQLDLSNADDYKTFTEKKKNSANTFHTIGTVPPPVKPVSPKMMKIAPLMPNGKYDLANAEPIDVNSPPGQLAISNMIIANEKSIKNKESAKFQLFEITTEKAQTTKAYLYEGAAVYSTDNGVTINIIDPKDPKKYTTIPIATTVGNDGARAVELNTENAHDIIKQANMAKNAKQALLEQDQVDIFNTYGDKDTEVLSDVMTHARNGTGPWATFQAAINNIVGGVTAFSPYKDTVNSRNILRSIRILARTNLIDNSRYAVAEVKDVNELFVNPEQFFADPKAQAQKFVVLKQLTISMRNQNLTGLSNGLIPKQNLADVLKQNRGLERILHLLKSVPISASGSISIKAISDARNLIFNKKDL